MRLINKWLPVVLLFNLLLTGCSDPKSAGLSGSGELQEEKRLITDVDSLKFSGFGEIILAKGDEDSFIIKTDENILKTINSRVIDKTLTVSFDSPVNKASKLEYHISLKNLKSITLSGSFELSNPKLLKLDSLSLQLYGAAKVNLNIKSKLLKTDIFGAGDVIYRGSADFHHIQSSGTGKIDAINLRTDRSMIIMNGFSKINLYAKDLLNGTIHGNGLITYSGNPKVEQRVYGLGSIIQNK